LQQTLTGLRGDNALLKGDGQYLHQIGGFEFAGLYLHGLVAIATHYKQTDSE